MQLDTLVSTALITVVTLFGFPSPSSQTAASAPSSQNGSCQKQYDYCMKNTAAKLRSNCEDLWKQCVYGKCAVSPRTQACVKDTDCKTSCTESATGKSGLLSCCMSAKHNNQCPTMIDWKCTKPGEAFPYAGGPKLNEGETPPNTLQDGDLGSEIKPDTRFQFPEGTTFDEKGNPSQPPLPQPDSSGKVLDPQTSEFFLKNFRDFDNPPNPNDRPLPDEYKPEIPYVPHKGERMFVEGTDGAIYSRPYYTLSDGAPSVDKEVAEYPTPQDAPYSGNPQTSNNSGQGQSTFQQQAPMPQTCSWSLWGWCLWH